jgi:tetratricopeptide (TPR) repeat protein
MTSYAALTDSADPIDRHAADLFCLLGFLPMSGCSVGGAYALMDAVPEHGDACVGRLVELQLVACDGVQLRLHDLLRLFAREVADTARAEGAMHRAAWYYAESAQRAWRVVRNLSDRPLPRGPLSRAQPAVFESRAEALRWMAAMAPSLRELIFALPAQPDVPTDLGVQIVRCLVSYDGIAGSFRETIEVSRCLVEWAAARHDPWAKLVGHRLTAINLQRLRRHPEARAAVAPAIALLPEVDDPAEKMNTLNTFGIFQTEWGDYEAAEHCLQSGLELARKVDDRSWLSIILHSLGMHYRVRGQTGRCIQLLRESLGIRQELDDAIGETYTRMQLGKALPAIGELDEGMTQLDIALRLAEHLESVELVREIRMDRMEVLAAAGRADTAAGELRAALDACRHLDDEALRAEVLHEAERLRVKA